MNGAAWLTTGLSAHPSFWLLLGAIAAFFGSGSNLATRRFAPIAGIAFAIPAVLAASRAAPGTRALEVSGFELVWFRADDLSLLFALIFAIVTLLGLLYGSHRDGPGRDDRGAALCGVGHRHRARR